MSGDVTFGKGVVLKGTVIIIANQGDRVISTFKLNLHLFIDAIRLQIDIPAGAILENKIVSGNLRILDH